MHSSIRDTTLDSWKSESTKQSSEKDKEVELLGGFSKRNIAMNDLDLECYELYIVLGSWSEYY